MGRLGIFHVVAVMLTAMPAAVTAHRADEGLERFGPLSVLAAEAIELEIDRQRFPQALERLDRIVLRNLHFICLDSHETDRSPDGPMLTWLVDDLMATGADWVIAFWHHPPYTKGSHDSDVEPPLVEMRENVLPILEDFGVDLVLAGHSHSYERSFLLDSHYGSSATLKPATMILNGGDGRLDDFESGDTSAWSLSAP